ncbi:MAG: hypothetical protein GY940_31645 [bacterium]|nr:hypothetical protein [bacterium]
MTDTDKDKKQEARNSNPVPLQTQLKRNRYETQLQELRRIHWSHMIAARFIYKSNNVFLNFLGLVEPRESWIDLWAGQAKDFYARVLSSEEILAKLEEFDITSDDIRLWISKMKNMEGNKIWIKECDDAWGQREYKLQAAMNRLNDYYTDMKKSFLQALKDEPEMLIELGMAESVEDVKEQQKRALQRNWKDPIPKPVSEREEEKNSEETES